jgi:hypothetical protein
VEAIRVDPSYGDPSSLPDTGGAASPDSAAGSGDPVLDALAAQPGAVTADTDGNGSVDTVGVDLSGTGHIDYVEHVNPDGSSTSYYDGDGDGVPDVVATDRTGDGTYDRIGLPSDPLSGTFTVTPPGGDTTSGTPPAEPGTSGDPVLGTFTPPGGDVPAGTPPTEPGAPSAPTPRTAAESGPPDSNDATSGSPTEPTFAGTAISGGSAVTTKPAEELIIAGDGQGYEGPSDFVGGTNPYEPLPPAPEG